MAAHGVQAIKLEDTNRRNRNGHLISSASQLATQNLAKNVSVPQGPLAVESDGQFWRAPPPSCVDNLGQPTPATLAYSIALSKPEFCP